MSNSRVLGALAGIVTIVTIVLPLLDKDPKTGPPFGVAIVISIAGLIVTALAWTGAAKWVAVILLLALAVNLALVEATVPNLDMMGRVVLGISLVLDVVAALALARGKRVTT